MSRKFIYTSDWTIPIDTIIRVTPNRDKVAVEVEGVTLYVSPQYDQTTRDVYQDIQRQLREAE